MSFDNKDKYKIDALLKEFSEVRAEVRTYEILQIMCIFISVLSFGSFFAVGVVTAQPILIFIAPAISIFLILMSMVMLSYTTICGLRGTQIENKMKKILGEPIIEWEQTVGVYNSIKDNRLIQKVGKYWVILASLAIIVGISTVIIGVSYGFATYYDKIGYMAWVFVIFYLIISAITIFIGYKFYTRDWEKIKLSL